MKVKELKERKFKVYVDEMLDFDYYKASNQLINALKQNMKGKLRKIAPFFPDTYEFKFSTVAQLPAIKVYNEKGFELAILFKQSSWGSLYHRYRIWRGEEQGYVYIKNDPNCIGLEFKQVLEWLETNYTIGRIVLNEI